MTTELPALTGGPLAGSSPDASSEWDVFATLPKIGLYRSEDHQYWFNGFGPAPSVTTVLKVLQKWPLTKYRERRIEEVAMTWGQWMEAGDAIATIDDERDTAARFGTSVHVLADLLGGDETALEGFPMTPEQYSSAKAFLGFLGHLRGSGGDIASSEKSVWSPANGYAGTYDLICLWHCERHSKCLWLIDLKTSSGVYADYALQLAGYVNAEYVALPGNPTLYKMPVIDHAAVLHVRPDHYPDTGWRLVEFEGLGHRDYTAFLAALDLWQWQQSGRYSYSKRQLTKGT